MAWYPDGYGANYTTETLSFECVSFDKKSLQRSCNCKIGESKLEITCFSLYSNKIFENKKF